MIRRVVLGGAALALAAAVGAGLPRLLRRLAIPRRRRT